MLKRAARMSLVMLFIVMAHFVIRADENRIIKSIIFPGMGQLGDDQKVRGLGYMAGEGLLLTMLFTEASQLQSHSRETDVLTIRYDMAVTYEGKIKQYNDWQDAYNKYSTARRNMFIYLGGAVVFWGWNIVDAVMFPPSKSSQESSVVKALKNNLAFAGTPDGAKVLYTTSF
ncbi:MAG: DUF5683 domain-containing protein [Chitinivibrionales bacterium]|nr:DUF5683 domain-containing protein [Chitinivibrionales bacterium]